MVIHIQAHQYMKTKSNLERQYNNALTGQVEMVCKKR